jgi:hypothetical protein
MACRSRSRPRWPSMWRPRCESPLSDEPTIRPRQRPHDRPHPRSAYFGPTARADHLRPGPKCSGRPLRKRPSTVCRPSATMPLGRPLIGTDPQRAGKPPSGRHRALGERVPRRDIRRQKTLKSTVGKERKVKQAKEQSSIRADYTSYAAIYACVSPEDQSKGYSVPHRSCWPPPRPPAVPVEILPAQLTVEEMAVAAVDSPRGHKDH